MAQTPSKKLPYGHIRVAHPIPIRWQTEPESEQVHSATDDQGSDSLNCPDKCHEFFLSLQTQVVNDIGL
jgi:hypothetical protein